MKKGISILLTLILVLSMVSPAFATFGDTFGDTGTEGDSTGTGGTVILPTAGDVLRGYIPTSNSLDFIIDPLGLLDMPTDGSVYIDFDNRNNIVNFNHDMLPGSDGDTLFAYNMSSVPVLLTLEMTIETTDVNVVTATDGTTNTTSLTDGVTNAANVLIWMEPNVDFLTEGGTGGDALTADDFTGIGRVVAFQESPGTTVRYRLEEIPHNEYPIGRTGSWPQFEMITELRPAPGAAPMYGTGFQFGGVFNRFGNWSTNRDIALSIQVTFRMEPIDRTCAVLGVDVTTLPFAREVDAKIAYGLLGVFDAFLPVNAETPESGLANVVPTLIPRPKQIENGETIDDTPDLTPRVTAVVSGTNNSTLTVTAHNFTFTPVVSISAIAQGGSNAGVSAPFSNLANAGPPVVAPDGSSVTFTLSAFWQTTGTTEGWTTFVFTDSARTVTITKANGAATTVDSASFVVN